MNLKIRFQAMRVVYLNRLPADDQGTFGIWSIPSLSWSCFSIELPDRGNKKCYSRIPSGEYTCTPYCSKKYRWVFILKDVHGRTYILIHSGNWAGDVLKGFKSHSMGCILLGRKPAYLHKQKAVLNSRSTIDIFMKKMEYKPFKLKVA
jgi:hypothetical protein